MGSGKALGSIAAAESMKARVLLACPRVAA